MGLIAYLSLTGSGREVGWGGRLFEAGRLLTFSAFRMGAYSRLALTRINTVNNLFFFSFKLHLPILTYFSISLSGQGELVNVNSH